jgi:hypothetical protein
MADHNCRIESTSHFQLYTLDTDLGLDAGGVEENSEKKWKSMGPNYRAHTRRIEAQRFLEEVES